MFDENANNFQDQNNLAYEFSTLDEVAKAEEDAKSSLCNLKLRNVNHLILGQININSIRNKFGLLFSLVSNNIDVLLISETKIDNTFPVSQFCVPGYSMPFRLDRTRNGGVIMLYFKKHTPCIMLNKFTFEKELKPLLLKLICVRLSGCCSVLITQIFVSNRYI